MKNHKEFNKYSGIVQQKHPQTKENIYVVYGYFSSEEFRERGGISEGALGDVLGWGISENEALENAVKNLIDYRRFSENKIEEIVELGRNVERINHQIYLYDLKNPHRIKDVYKIDDQEEISYPGVSLPLGGEKVFWDYR